MMETYWKSITILIVTGSILCGLSGFIELPGDMDPPVTLVEGAFSGGDGTSSNPYQISNITQLQDMKTDLEANYTLINDIDASSTSGWNGGAGFEPIGNGNNNFIGFLSGKEYKIKNLVINRPTSGHIGLIGYLGSGGLIENVTIEDAKITGDSYVGTTVGRSRFGSVINCSSTGVVNGVVHVGGLVGSLYWGRMFNCTATCTVGNNANEAGGLIGHTLNSEINSSHSSGIVNGFNYVSGLIGYCDYGSVTDSCSFSKVTGTGARVGGLIGYNTHCTVKNCYSTGSVKGTALVGGLIGNHSYGSVSFSFWDNVTSGLLKSSGGVGKNTTDMKTRATFTSVGWDFNSTWTMRENVTYPILKIFYIEPVNLNDTDNDGVIDTKDEFPNNPFEYRDTDGDGMGDNLDPDADNDGYPDNNDSFPLDDEEWQDTDMDGIGNNADQDDDNDGVPDSSDAFPLDPSEAYDADSDGIGDRLDPDDDNNGVNDFEEFNQTMLSRFDSLTDQISIFESNLQEKMERVNRSLIEAITKLDSDFILKLQELNSTLSEKIELSMITILDLLNEMNISIAFDIEDLDQDIQAVLEKMISEIGSLNKSLDLRLSDLEDLNLDLFLRISNDLDSIKDMIVLFEINLTEITMGHLRSKLIELAMNVSYMDLTLKEKLLRIAGNISSFKEETLFELLKLNSIIFELGYLNGYLIIASNEIYSNVDEKGDEQTDQSTVNIILLVVTIILIGVVIFLLIRLKKAGELEQQEKEDESTI
ncbi:MAG: GLUG motif-containing protein [Thermoplasmatota archaeon]